LLVISILLAPDGLPSGVRRLWFRYRLRQSA
jgi:hypothetical protein